MIENSDMLIREVLVKGRKKRQQEDVNRKYL